MAYIYRLTNTTKIPSNEQSTLQSSFPNNIHNKPSVVETTISKPLQNSIMRFLVIAKNNGLLLLKRVHVDYIVIAIVFIIIAVMAVMIIRRIKKKSNIKKK